MIEYKKTPEQRLIDAIENDIAPLPPTCSLDRYNKAELRQILKDWVLIYEGVSKLMSARVNDVGRKEGSTKTELMMLIKKLSTYASLQGGVRKSWESLNKNFSKQQEQE